MRVVIPSLGFYNRHIAEARIVVCVLQLREEANGNPAGAAHLVVTSSGAAVYVHVLEDI